MSLLKLSNLKDGAIDFNSFSRQELSKQVTEGIALAEKSIDQIINSQEEPTFENTILAYETSSDPLDQVSGVFWNIHGADCDEVMEKQSQEISQALSAFSTSVQTNEKLFAKVKAIYDTGCSDLNPEQKKLVEKMYKSFSRSGVGLSPEDKEVYKALSAESSKLTLDFSQKLLKQSSEYELHLTKEEDLAGLPPRVVEQAASEAESKGKKGWLFTLDFASYGDFMQNSDRRDLREQYYKAVMGRGMKAPYDNKETLKSILKNREKRAKLLGYKDFATYVLEERMAKNPQKVWSFLEELKEKCYKFASKDFEELSSFAAKCSLEDKLMPWDSSYYAKKLQSQKFDFDPETLRPFFSLDKVMKGLFDVAGKLYGLELKKNSELPVYHKDVEVYEVYKRGAYYGLIYFDLFPRATKRSGAWQTTFRSQGLSFGEVRRPHVSIVCNFTKPTKTTPSLLSFREVETLFHEFGHGLHSLLSCCTYQTLSGTSVDWDFVELPSQIMENWARQEDVLKSFACHYETGEPISAEQMKKLRESELFRAGSGFLRQVFLSALDMHWHTPEGLAAENVQEFENQIAKQYSYFEPVENCGVSTSFAHIFAGGYSVGYYSYKWAELLEADAFEVFEQKGLFSQEVASKFEDCILSKGGTEDSALLYEKFRGSEPKVDPLLKKYGLL